MCSSDLKFFISYFKDLTYGSCSSPRIHAQLEILSLSRHATPLPRASNNNNLIKVFFLKSKSRIRRATPQRDKTNKTFSCIGFGGVFRSFAFRLFSSCILCTGNISYFCYCFDQSGQILLPELLLLLASTFQHFLALPWPLKICLELQILLSCGPSRKS